MKGKSLLIFLMPGAKGRHFIKRLYLHIKKYKTVGWFCYHFLHTKATVHNHYSKQRKVYYLSASWPPDQVEERGMNGLLSCPHLGLWLSAWPILGPPRGQLESGKHLDWTSGHWSLRRQTVGIENWATSPGCALYCAASGQLKWVTTRQYIFVVKSVIEWATCFGIYPEISTSSLYLCIFFHYSRSITSAYIDMDWSVSREF